MKRWLKESKLVPRLLPVFVWAAAAVGVSVLFLHQSETVQLKGIAFSHEQIINTTETGYIRSIPVKLYQEVKKGDNRQWAMITLQYCMNTTCMYR